MSGRENPAVSFFAPLLAAWILAACAAMPAGSATAGSSILRGTARVVGNVPFTWTVVTVDADPAAAVARRDYLIVGPLEKEIRARHQGRRVRLEGETCESPVPHIRNCFRPTKVVSEEGR